MRAATGRVDADGNQVWDITKGAHVKPGRGHSSTTRQSMTHGRRNPARASMLELLDFRSMVATRPAWFYEGTCNSRQELDWAPATREEGRKPRAVCWEVCPVREQCLAWALEHHESGCWGGTLDYERTRMRKTGRTEATPPRLMPAPQKSKKRNPAQRRSDEAIRARNKALAEKRQTAMKRRTAEIAQYLAAGRTPESIAYALGITKRTVERHVALIRAAQSLGTERKDVAS